MGCGARYARQRVGGAALQRAHGGRVTKGSGVGAESAAREQRRGPAFACFGPTCTQRKAVRSRALRQLAGSRPVPLPVCLLPGPVEEGEGGGGGGGGGPAEGEAAGE
jgi:hypothetical protein